MGLLYKIFVTGIVTLSVNTAYNLGPFHKFSTKHAGLRDSALQLQYKINLAKEWGSVFDIQDRKTLLDSVSSWSNRRDSLNNEADKCQREMQKYTQRTLFFGYFTE